MHHNGSNKLMLFSGNANPELAHAISNQLGVNLGQAIVSKFSDGEPHVEIHENVRGRDVYILQSTCPPANDHLMEILTLADALRRSSAARITAIIPYFGYARQDRRVRSARVPITARLVADTLTTVGIDRIITVDIHAEQIQGFFNIPLDNVFGTPVLVEYMRTQNFNFAPVVVSPDVGGVVRARAFAKILNCDLAIIDKRRPKANDAQIMHIIGEVKDRTCLIIDDMVDTAGTLCKAAQALMDNGAGEVFAYSTHPILSGNAIQTIQNSVLKELVVTDSIPLSKAAHECDKIKQASLDSMLSEAIRRISSGESLSMMFAGF
jgi:ribose-phosphate pyrophosphokinase